ncbi:MAG: DUF2164 domain-containing protein [Halanaerobiaceae bacterium]|nr:DUF2164 domain-containing protein [Halanaerobiaceae bacterium]
MKLKDEEKRGLIKELQQFFLEERGEEPGIIASEKILDFFMENLGALIYNKALDDARFWLKRRLEDLELDYDLLYKG